MRPSIDNLVVTLVICNESHIIVVGNLTYLIVTLLDQLSFLLRDNDIVEVERQTCQICHTVTKVLNTVEELAGLSKTNILNHVSNNATETLLRDHLIDITYLIRDNAINDNTTYRSFYHMALWLTIDDIVNDYLHLGMEIALTLIVGNDGLFRTVEGQAFTLCTWTDLGDIVETKHHILRRHGNRRTISRVQDVMTLKHQQLSLQNSLIGKRKVHSHLVTIEVSVERGTCQWVQLDCLTLDQLGLEGLDTQTVQCWCTIEEHGMTLHHILKDIPDNWLTTINDLLSTLHRLHDTALNELTDNERLIELSSHQLRQTTLTHLQLRTYNDHRTCRIVNTLTEEVLTEAALLTLQRVRERFQRTVRLTLYGT